MKNFLLIFVFLILSPSIGISNDEIEQDLDDEALECLLIFEQEFIFECEGEAETLER